MTEEHKERIYEGVRRMVIWDEPRADVFHRLEVNGIDSVKALRMYQEARAERIAMIRRDSVRKALGGLGLLLAGVVLFVVFWDGFGGITRLLFYLCVVAVGFGTWRLFKGVFGFLFAHTKEGSLANDD